MQESRSVGVGSQWGRVVLYYDVLREIVIKK